MTDHFNTWLFPVPNVCIYTVCVYEIHETETVWKNKMCTEWLITCNSNLDECVNNISVIKSLLCIICHETGSCCDSSIHCPICLKRLMSSCASLRWFSYHAHSATYWQLRVPLSSNVLFLWAKFSSKTCDSWGPRQSTRHLCSFTWPYHTLTGAGVHSVLLALIE